MGVSISENNCENLHSVLDHLSISITHGKNMNTTSYWRWLFLLVRLLNKDLNWCWHLGANCLTIVTPYHIILEESSITTESQNLSLLRCSLSVAVLIYPLLSVLTHRCFPLFLLIRYFDHKLFWESYVPLLSAVLWNVSIAIQLSSNAQSFKFLLLK